MAVVTDQDRIVGQLEAKIDLVLQRMDGVDQTHEKLEQRLSKVEANQQRLLGVMAFCGFVLPLLVAIVTTGAFKLTGTPAGLSDVLGVLCAERGYDQDEAACKVLRGYQP